MVNQNSASLDPVPPSDIDINALLRELDASKLSVARFARERGVSSWRLYEARRKAAKRPRRRKPPRQPSPSFVPIEIAKTATENEPIELVLSSGHRLRMPLDFDEALLRRLMGVLASC